jgi:hypothetical protein
MSDAAHTLYASYSYSVSNGDASVQDLKTLVGGIKDSAKCNCLACKVVTTMCETCNKEDEYILAMSKEMTEADAWGVQVSANAVPVSLCPFGSDRRWEIEAASQHNEETESSEANQE